MSFTKEYCFQQAEKNLPFKANCGIKVCMKERKMALAIKTSFVMQTHFSWKQ